MEQRKPVYKLYKDASKIVKNTMYLRPLCMAIGTGAGTLISCGINPDNKVLVGICTGISGLLVINGLRNISKFKRENHKLELAKERLKVFQDEAKKIFDKDVNLDIDNVLLEDDFCAFPTFFENYNIIFKDGGFIKETICNGKYNCSYFKIFSDADEKQKEVDLSDAVYKAYHIIP